jgi:pimeloyl-ACP methyl ester carboxylesterase
VEEGVRLEVLDWGGSGRAVVLLTGSGHSAHVFDEIAPKLTDSYRVLGITRRGYGASSKPPSGYSDERRADDVLRILDSMNLATPVLAGHSMGGDELTTLGRQHPKRLGGLVYLDALADPMDFPSGDPSYMALFARLPLPMQEPSCARDTTSFAAFRAFFSCMKMPLPESELRNTFAAEPDGSVGRSVTPDYVTNAVAAGKVRRDYANIGVPVLALFGSREVATPAEGGRVSAQERRGTCRRRRVRKATKAYVDRWVASLEAAVPDARLVDLPGRDTMCF